jgi:hypothetical protein
VFAILEVPCLENKFLERKKIGKTGNQADAHQNIGPIQKTFKNCVIVFRSLKI